MSENRDENISDDLIDVCCDQPPGTWARPLGREVKRLRLRVRELEAQAGALHAGYRGFMLGRTARLGPAAPTTARLGAWSCDCTCGDEEWMEGEAEKHKPDCMARPDYVRSHQEQAR